MHGEVRAKRVTQDVNPGRHVRTLGRILIARHQRASFNSTSWLPWRSLSGNGFESVSWLVWREFVQRASGWADLKETSLKRLWHRSGACRSRSGQASGRLTCHSPPLAVSENLLGIDAPEPVESSRFRGCEPAPRLTYQVFNGTRSLGSCSPEIPGAMSASPCRLVYCNAGCRHVLLDDPSIAL